MKIVKTETVEENGESYTINVYDNGVREKFLSNSTPRIIEPPILTPEQEVAYSILVNTEALVLYAELGG